MRTSRPYPLLLAAVGALTVRCGRPTSPPSPTRGTDAEQTAFTCGELDLYDLDAIVSGGAFEGKCTDVPVGTWRRVAADLRAATQCDRGADYEPDPREACDIAGCANSLFAGAAAATCADLTAFAEAFLAPECRVRDVDLHGFRLLPC